LDVRLDVRRATFITGVGFEGLESARGRPDARPICGSTVFGLASRPPRARSGSPADRGAQESEPVSAVDEVRQLVANLLGDLIPGGAAAQRCRPV